ncbi:flagellar hook-length control protein FliK [Falsirhodobacter sp. 1013]|uniref:flagellar hook-length control protein FliK n=1 Tax=Falsirhodobacter sp. 1013 TaxID=3417566 RepID=UPI003EC06BD0
MRAAAFSTGLEAASSPAVTTPDSAAIAYAPTTMPAPTSPSQDVASAKVPRPRPDTATEVSASEPAAASVVPLDLRADIPPVPAEPTAAPTPTSSLDTPRGGFEAAVPEAARKQAEAVVHAQAETLTRDSVGEDQGRVHVTLQRDGDDWRVVVSADNPATLDLMRRHADQLQQDLAQQGFGGAQLDFSEWKEPETPEPQADTGHEVPAPRAEMARYTHSPLLPSSGLDLRL